MDSLIQSDIFLGVVGVSLITIAVFMIFVLGLLIKILSDLSLAVDRVKKETDQFVGDMSAIRSEIKNTVKTFNVYVSALLTANGLKQFMSFLAGTIGSSRTKDKKKSRRVKVASVSDN